MTPVATLVRAVLLAVALAGFSPEGASAQGNRWERRVADELRRAGGTLRFKGFARPQATRIGPLNNEESESFAVTLEAGVSYALIGVCDNDCSRLELVLATATRSELAAARASENVPFLQFTPRQTMSYRVKAVMAACRMNPCWYGVGVYGK